MIDIHYVFGPNLSQLGQREPEVYGQTSLADIKASILQSGQGSACHLHFMQSDHEGEIVRYIHACSPLKAGDAVGLVINAGGLSHTSVSIRDAIATRADLTAISVHQTQVARREVFRQTDIVATACLASISGFGAFGYCLALSGLIEHLKTQQQD